MKTIRKVMAKMIEEGMYKKNVQSDIAIENLDPDEKEKCIFGKKDNAEHCEFIVVDLVIYNMDYHDSIIDIFENFHGVEELAIQMLVEDGEVFLESVVKRFIKDKVGNGTARIYDYETEDGEIVEFAILPDHIIEGGKESL